MKNLLCICCLLAILYSNNNLFAQNASDHLFDKITPKDFTVHSPVVDSNTEAVILADWGKTEFEGNSKGWVSWIYKRKKRILILKKKAVDLADVAIRMYFKEKYHSYEDKEEVITEVSGTTYNLDNGTVIETKLNKKDVFVEKTDKHHNTTKFAMPAVKENSIIDISYTIKSDFEFNIPSWTFQNGRIPTLWSDYSIEIPSLLSYMSVYRMNHPLFIKKDETGHKTYTVIVKNPGALIATEQSLSVMAEVSKYRWVMRDLPAFENEEFVNSPENLKDYIRFQLYQTYNGEKTDNVFNTWKKTIENLEKDENFLDGLKLADDWATETLSKIEKSGIKSQNLARSIFEYVQNNFICSNHNKIFITDKITNVIKTREGNVGEINLLLISLLRKAGMNADPAILSTTGNGKASTNYPELEGFNYLICRLKTDSLDYLLDASQPRLGFGILDKSCYNDFARVIASDSAIIPLQAASLNEKKYTYIQLTKEPLGFLHGVASVTYGMDKSLQLRRQIANDSVNYLKENEQELSNDMIHFSHGKFDSLNQNEFPLNIHYQVELQQPNADIVYIKPFSLEGYTTNMFPYSIRKNPVDLPFTSDEVYSFTMELPAGYSLEELPKSAKISLNEQDALFEFKVASDYKSYVMVRSRLQFKTILYNKSEYDNLINFYAAILKKFQEMIVLKKKPQS